MGVKVQISKIWTSNFFLITLYYNLAKFQLHSTSRSKSLGKSVFWRYRDFKFRDPFFTKIGPFSPNIFQNPKNLPGFDVFYGLAPWVTWKKHHQTCLKPILSENIHHFDSFWALFLYGKILRKRGDFRHTRPHSNANNSS